MRNVRTILVLILVILALLASYFTLRLLNSPAAPKTVNQLPNSDTLWKAPDTGLLDQSEEAALIRYGRALIANTSYYLGPKGTVGHLTNGMNCQNCHLDAGTRAWGNNFAAVNSMYPIFRQRSGTNETIFKRVTDCFERSLNGKAPDTNSREMQAIKKYIVWLGQRVPVKTKPAGAGIKELPLLARAADPRAGKAIYINKCQRCHGANGEGIPNSEPGSSYLFPPLWGDDSYNTGAGLYRLSRFAGYVKSNMPFDKHSDTAMTVEECWDVAAFVNSQPRPQKIFKGDWPDISGKPFDHPFGPYKDSFSEKQHKYGPFTPIQQQKSAIAKNGNKAVAGN